MIEVGAIIPNTGGLPEDPGIRAMAEAAEQAGAASIWVSDHLLMVDEEHADYPYSVDGRPTWPNDVPYYEALTCCALMVGATSACRVGTAILVLPQRHVLEVAKTAATLDRLSDGRFALGVGAGWNRLEMEALGYSYADRGRRFDEMLDVLRSCWTGRPPGFRGAHVTVPDNVVLSPTPTDPHGPPLLVGGMGDAALRRAAERGDGWLALAFVSTWDEDMLASRLAVVTERRASCGAPRPLHNVLKLHATPAQAELLPEHVHTAAVIGFDEVIVEPPWEAGLDEAAAAITAACAAGRQG